MIQRQSAKAKGRRLENRVAKQLGGQRTPLSGAVGGGDASDGLGRFSIECKSRAQLPALVRDAFGQAERDLAVGDNRKPLVVLKADHEEPIYCLRESAFLDLLTDGGMEHVWHVKNRLKAIIKLAKEAHELSG